MSQALNHGIRLSKWLDLDPALPTSTVQKWPSGSLLDLITPIQLIPIQLIPIQSQGMYVELYVVMR